MRPVVGHIARGLSTGRGLPAPGRTLFQRGGSARPARSRPRRPLALRERALRSTAGWSVCALPRLARTVPASPPTRDTGPVRACARHDKSGSEFSHSVGPTCHDRCPFTEVACRLQAQKTKSTATRRPPTARMAWLRRVWLEHTRRDEQRYVRPDDSGQPGSHGDERAAGVARAP